MRFGAPRASPHRTEFILRPQPPHAHTLLSTTARMVAAGPLYGPRHTRMCVSSLAEAVVPSWCMPPTAQGERLSVRQSKAAKVKPETLEKEFWLVATLQDCKVVTAQETASAKCFLKIHWEDDAFPEKIRGEKLKLLSGTVAETDINMKLEKMAVELEKGDLVYGMLDAAPDSFPINIDSIFLNQISSERIGGLCWTLNR